MVWFCSHHPQSPTVCNCQVKFRQSISLLSLLFHYHSSSPTVLRYKWKRILHGTTTRVQFVKCRPAFFLSFLLRFLPQWRMLKMPLACKAVFEQCNNALNSTDRIMMIHKISRLIGSHATFTYNFLIWRVYVGMPSHSLRTEILEREIIIRCEDNLCQLEWPSNLVEEI